MKKLALGFLVTLLCIPAAAQAIYSSGPTNGNWNAWTINFGFIVSDTFTVSSFDTPITGASFAMWLFPGDTLESAQLSITSGENGGTTYFDQTVNFSQTSCAANQYAYNVCTENTSFFGPTLNTGTYWLNLQNAQTATGDPVFWDQTVGPHTNLGSASENTVGTIPGETFTLLGETTFGSNSSLTTAAQSVPEPGSLLLFASGALGLAGFLRSKAAR